VVKGDWFMNKKKLERLQQQKAQEEMQTKININRALSKMKAQSLKLENFKKDYIEKARKAVLIGNKQNYQVAKNGLKQCVSKQRMLEGMIGNFELLMQLNDMNKVVGEFVKGIDSISAEMKKIVSSPDMIKTQQNYEKALASSELQYETLDCFLSASTESLGGLCNVDTEVSDDEIDKLISVQAADSETSIDEEIDSKIADIRNKMSAE
jgi:hypothetical protein